MGINGLGDFLKKKPGVTEAYFDMPYDKLSGKRIAIDAYGWMYKSLANARKKIIDRTDLARQEPNVHEIRKEWLNSSVDFVTGWFVYNITPIFVFDGEHPVDKHNKKNERREKRKLSKDKIDALYHKIKTASSFLELSPNIIEELRKELKNYTKVTKDDVDIFKKFVQALGAPCIQAPGEAEEECSMLCIDKKVAAVFSVDTDNLVYGCPLLITGFSYNYIYDEYGMQIPQVKCIRIDKILDALSLTHSQFVDLCIMAGCDYNKNMPKCAAGRSYDLIKEYVNIENLPKRYDITCLNHRRCRELFSYKSFIVADADLVVDLSAIENYRDFLIEYDLAKHIHKIQSCYKCLTAPSDGWVDDLKLKELPKYKPPAILKCKNVTLRIIG